MSTRYTIQHYWDGQDCHPKERVHCSLSFTGKDQLQLNIDAPFHNDPAPPDQKGSFWGLWDYEVVEVFLVAEDGQYLEAEFGPHGHHLLLWLDRPRNIVQKHLDVQFHVRIDSDRWKGQAIIPTQHLPHPIHRFNLFAIHGIDAHRRYLCYQPLKTVKPDFHRPERFPFFQR